MSEARTQELAKLLIVDDLPDNRQTLEEAIAAYTRDSAYADFMEGRKGQLKAGMLADCVLLNGDIVSEGTGFNKKEAGQVAAQKALEKLM